MKKKQTILFYCIFFYAHCKGLFLNNDAEFMKKFQFTNQWIHKSGNFPLKQDPEWMYKIPGCYVVELKNASIYSTQGIIITDENKIYTDSLWTWSPLYKAPSDLFPLPEASTFNGTLATIALEGHSNYFHWMLEILPRIYLLQQSGYHYDKLYVPPLRYQFQRKTLELIGINYDDIIIAKKETHIAPKSIIFPSQPARSCISPEWVINFLQKVFLSNYKVKNGKKRLFISRENAKFRKIINENEIFTLLEPLGFEKVFMEQYSVEDQAHMIHEAEIIVGTHGAGLTNIVFARPNTILIELFQEHLDQCFFDLSKVINLKYYCIKTDTISEKSQMSIDIRYRNTFIEVKKLKKQLLNLIKKK